MSNISFLSCSSEVHVVRMQELLCELNICTDQNVVLQKEEHQNVFTSQLRHSLTTKLSLHLPSGFEAGGSQAPSFLRQEVGNLQQDEL